jgi:predicted ester cyclase
VTTNVNTSANKAAARRLYEEVVNQGRLEVLDELVAEDGLDRPGAGRWAAGREGFRQHVIWLRETVGEATTTVTDLIAEGDRVVVFWRLEGTHRGTLFGATATGRRVSGDSISWLTFHNGLIVEYGVLPDRQQFLRDLAG